LTLKKNTEILLKYEFVICSFNEWRFTSAVNNRSSGGFQAPAASTTITGGKIHEAVDSSDSDEALQRSVVPAKQDGRE
jgi:hypothetical protein